MPRAKKKPDLTHITEQLRPLAVEISTLVEDPANARLHPTRNMEAITASLRRFGQRKPVVVRREGMIVEAGNGTLAAARALGWRHLAAVLVDDDATTATGFAIADNRTAELAEWDDAALAKLLGSVKDEMPEVELGFSDEDLAALFEGVGLDEQLDGEGEPVTPEDRPTLAEQFLVPPFSVLDARQGYWQERKRQWLALGIKSEEGRAGGLAFNIGKDKTEDNYWSGESGRAKRLREKEEAGGLVFGGKNHSGRDPAFYKKKKETEAALGKTLSTEDFIADYYDPGGGGTGLSKSGTSVFDPVLCELAYRWFCPRGGKVLDPFAGGSVRGVVASLLGLAYTGVELRPEQVEANRKQAKAICGGASEQQALVPEVEMTDPKALTPVRSRVSSSTAPRWIEGDSLNVQSLVGRKDYDLLFTCPPYFNLERYSDDPQDISNAKSYEIFLESYGAILKRSVELIADNRFAVVVVGNVRAKRGGFYTGFVRDTIEAMEEAGARLYNDAILVTSLGSLPVRAGRAFKSGRKLGPTHQRVLVFFKGDPGTIRDTLGDVEVSFPEQLDET